MKADRSVTLCGNYYDYFNPNHDFFLKPNTVSKPGLLRVCYCNHDDEGLTWKHRTHPTR